MPKRFQLDPEWQRDFFALAEARAEQREHVAAGLQLRNAGVLDEARAELTLADAAHERAELLLQKLKELT
jgi:hypothetical protein